MSKYEVVEKFVSINGEGTKAGQLAVFIRFKGCNLNCKYCDTKWANEQGTPSQPMTEKEILDYVLSTGVKNVTLTGGEPLLREGIENVITVLAENNLNIEIETNGSVYLDKIRKLHKENVTFTMDYKLSCSGMEAAMNLDNFDILNSNDTVKFVAGCREDLIKAKQIIEKYNLYGKCNLYISPVFGMIEPEEIVNFMKENVMNDVICRFSYIKLYGHQTKKESDMEKHKKIDTKAIEYHIAGILKALGDNPEREGLKDTPKRVAKMYEEVFDGMNYTNEEIADMFNKTFALDMDEEESGQIECNGQSGTSNMVVVKDIDIFSYCEHHLALMYDMKVTVAYIPNGRVIGLSKIARIADMVSKRLQLQERIGSDIADIMHMVTGAKDIAVFIEGCHSCMTARGIKKANTKTYTQTLRGRFNNESNGFVQWWNR